MKAALLWTTGLTASLGAHAALFAFMALASEPDPLEAEPAQSGKVKMTSYEVPQSKAEAQDAKGVAQDASAAEGQALGQGPVRSENASAAPLPHSVQPAEVPESEQPAALIPDNTALAEIENETVVEASAASGAPVPALRAEGAQAKAAPPSAEALAAAAPPPVTTAATLPNPDAAQSLSTAQPAQAALAPVAPSLSAASAPAAQAQAAALPATLLASASVEPPTLSASAPNAGPVPASSLITEASAQISADGAETLAKAPPAQPAPSRTPDAPIATEPPLDAPIISAATGWSGETTNFDPTSLAAVQSFMQPLDTADQSGTPRDAISQLLSSVPCARLAATFVPETGQLELRGHIPDETIREPILTAIRQQLGESIPVGGSMLVLPSPQCDVLSRLENLGLPQSQGQQRDAKELGALTQIATFDYGSGERVIVKMRSPDYPAYVYVDFFDVEGRVLHLRPNQWEDVELHEPDTPLAIGADREGQTSVKLLVRPPFGQELAIAYASSRPLYEGLRETIEPAEAYLDYMRTRIAELKAEDPDYKGEWVYMFIQTHE